MFPFHPAGGPATSPGAPGMPSAPAPSQASPQQQQQQPGQMGHPMMMQPMQGQGMGQQGMMQPGMGGGLMQQPQSMMFNPLLMQQQMAMMAQQNPQLLMQMQQMMQMQFMQQQMAMQQQHQHQQQQQQQQQHQHQQHSPQPPQPSPAHLPGTPSMPHSAPPPHAPPAPTPAGAPPPAAVASPHPFNPAMMGMGMGMAGQGGLMGQMPMGPMMGQMGFGMQGMAPGMMAGMMPPHMQQPQPSQQQQQMMMAGRPASNSLTSLPPLTPQTLAPLPPTSSTPDPTTSPTTPPEPDAFAALDAERNSASSMLELPGAPLRMKVQPTPPAAVVAQKGGKGAVDGGDEDFGDFQHSTTPPPQQPSPPQQPMQPQQMTGQHPMMMRPMQGMQGMQGMQQGGMPGMQGAPQGMLMQGMGMGPMMQQQPGMAAMQGGGAAMMMQQPGGGQGSHTGGMGGHGMMGMWSPQQGQPHPQQGQAFHPHQNPQGMPPFAMTPGPLPTGAFSPSTQQSPHPSAPALHFQPQQTSPLAPTRVVDDDFAPDFSSFQSAAPPPPTAAPTAGPPAPGKPVDEDDDFFPTFESAPAAGSAGPTAGAGSSSPLPPLPTPAPPAPAVPPPPPAAASVDDLLHSALDKAFDHGKANAPLVDTPAPLPMSALHPTKAPPPPVIPHHRGRDLPPDLDDLLNEIMPEAKVVDAPLPTLPFDNRSRVEDAADFDFGGFASASGSTTTGTAGAEEEADFAQFESAPASAPAAAAKEEGKGKGKKKGRLVAPPANEEEAAIAAAIAAAQKKGAKGSFAFASSPTSTAASPTQAKAAVLTSIAAPTVALPTFGAPPPVSVVSLTPSTSVAAPSAGFFQTSAAAAVEEDDFEAEFERAPPTQSAAANPFGIGIPSTSPSAGGGGEHDFADEEEESVAAAPALDAVKAAPPELLGGAELAKITPVPATAASAAPAAAPAFFGFGDDAAGQQNWVRVSGATGAEDDGFADFAAPPRTVSSAPSPSSAASPLALVIPPSPTPIPPPSPSPSPSPSFPSPKTSTALASYFSFSPLPSPLPIPPSFDGAIPGSADVAASMLEAQERFDELLELQKFLSASLELPALTSRYKEALALSMDDEDQLPVAMTLQAQIKRLKGQQAKEEWLRPMDESAAIAHSPPRLTYAQIVRLLMAVNVSALGSFSSRYPQPFAAVASSSSPAEASLVKAAANRELRSVVGLFPAAAAQWRARAAAVSTFIASQLSVGSAFVQQIDRMDVGKKVNDKVTAALAPAVSFLTAIAALYRVHLRIQLARHTYAVEGNDGEGGECDRHWREAKTKMDGSAVWKLYGPTIKAMQHKKPLAGDGKSGAPPPLLTVDAERERKAVAVDGTCLQSTCDLCLGRLQCEVDGVSRVEGVEGGDFHTLCANIYQQVVLGKRKS